MGPKKHGLGDIDQETLLSRNCVGDITQETLLKRHYIGDIILNFLFLVDIVYKSLFRRHSFEINYKDYKDFCAKFEEKLQQPKKGQL